MTIAHNLGFPRIGAHRELKWAVEAYWKKEVSQSELLNTARELRQRHWKLQQDAGLDCVPVGDFSFYDQMLDHSAMFGAVPKRFKFDGANIDLDTYFRMARGRAPSGEPAAACEMTKWFDTNYHYLVPELHRNQQFKLSTSRLFDEVEEAKALGLVARPVLIGPLTWLFLGKTFDGSERLDLLEALLPVYEQILAKLQTQGVAWVQIDEPILALDLSPAWQAAFKAAYASLAAQAPKILLATYFGALQDNLELATGLPVAGLHVDLVRAPEQLPALLAALKEDSVLSLGVVNGRNIWRNDIEATLKLLEPVYKKLGQRLWIGPSCSMLHVPVDLGAEKTLDAELLQWLAFATQKISEIQIIRQGLTQGRSAIATALAQSDAAAAARRQSKRLHRDDVRQRLAQVDEAMTCRNSPYPVRAQAQKARFQLPLFPTTTIGSFPQTAEIRNARRDFKAGKISQADYDAAMQEQIRLVVKAQEDYDIDVLVHGEPERNDMVEYFGEQLDGFAFSANGWVQSYGSRCVKPPVIFGDVARPTPMTLAWSQFAQSLTKRPMKGMLTGPVTILQWSFVRDDQPRAQTCLQIALALRDEVCDLERGGIGIIQIDEPAVREGLPLRRSDWQAYLDWAVRCFRISASGVADDTQIHTHMCYSEFNDIIKSIAAMDADVITIETARSAMELLDAFSDFEYPNEIGPGVYDIHSPNVPSVEQMVALMRKAAERIPAARLWVNPDCGLKTRNWPEVAQSLQNMVTAAKQLRA